MKVIPFLCECFEMFLKQLKLKTFFKNFQRVDHICMTALASRRVGGVGFRSCVFECEMYPPKLRFPALFFYLWADYFSQLELCLSKSLTLPFFNNGILSSPFAAEKRERSVRCVHHF